MKNISQLVKNLMTEESGQDLIEYALVAALVGLGAVAAIRASRTPLGAPSTASATSSPAV